MIFSNSRQVSQFKGKLNVAARQEVAATLLAKINLLGARETFSFQKIARSRSFFTVLLQNARTGSSLVNAEFIPGSRSRLAYPLARNRWSASA